MRRRAWQRAEVDEDTLANYTAARAFLYGEWFGASVCVASVTLLYVFAFARPDVPAWTAIAVCLCMLAVGGFAFLRNRAYYERLGFPWANRWHQAAFVVAGSGGFFWLLFAFLSFLAWRGIAVGPR